MNEAVARAEKAEQERDEAVRLLRAVLDDGEMYEGYFDHNSRISTDPPKGETAFVRARAFLSRYERSEKA